MTQVGGRIVVTDPALLMSLPIINLPAGTRRIRIRRRTAIPRLYVKTANSVRPYIAAFVDDQSAIELIPCFNEGNYTRDVD